jgi:hypothetical protein
LSIIGRREPAWQIESPSCRRGEVLVDEPAGNVSADGSQGRCLMRRQNWKGRSRQGQRAVRTLGVVPLNRVSATEAAHNALRYITLLRSAAPYL